MSKNAKRMREKMMREAAEADRPENRVHPKERLLPSEFIQKVQTTGLFIDDFPFFPSGHVGTPSGYTVILPAKNGGNRGYDIEFYFTDASGADAITYMPSVVIWGDGSVWHTTVHEYTPGPGPGDFNHVHTSLDEAFSDLMSYFFDASNEHYQAMVKANCTEK